MWRKNIDPLLRDHLEMQIKESYRHRRGYTKAKDVSKAQLWCAIANLSKQVFDLSLKIKFLERTLQEVLGKKKRSNNDVKKILESLQKF